MMYNMKDLGLKWSPVIRLKIVIQSDRRNWFKNVLLKTFQMKPDTPIKAES